MRSMFPEKDEINHFLKSLTGPDYSKSLDRNLFSKKLSDGESQPLAPPSGWNRPQPRIFQRGAQ